MIAALLLCLQIPVASSEEAADPPGLLKGPAHGLRRLGDAAAGSGVWVAEETGRFLQAVARLAEAPALALEAGTRERSALDAAGEALLEGSGRLFTASCNLFSVVDPGPSVDLGKDAEVVERALRFLDRLDDQDWRLDENDDRPRLFPHGTRVRARGRSLEWTIPGPQGPRTLLQSAEQSQLFRTMTRFSGEDQYAAQERSWGFVVPDRARWDRRSQRSRAIIIVHEFYHQYAQIDRHYRGWSALYWPAYGAGFLQTGWTGHWAETQGPLGAAAVDRALWRWYP